MSDRVTVSIDDDGIADVRMNRPDKLNALDQEMFLGLLEAGEQVAETKGVRAAVLSGVGRAFCAGLDFASFQAATGGERAETSKSLFDRSASSPANMAQRAAFIWNEVPVPVIAAIHGVAYGGGLQIALGADIRFVAPDARLSVRELHWGLVPDMSGTQTLRHLVRQDVAKELVYTARIVEGPEAVALGLATHLSDTPFDAALALAREIAGRSPHAVRAAKQLMNAAPLVSLAEGLKLEEDLQRTVIGGPNNAEAVRANMEKRKPRFSDPD